MEPLPLQFIFAIPLFSSSSLTSPSPLHFSPFVLYSFPILGSPLQVQLGNWGAVSLHHSGPRYFLTKCTTPGPLFLLFISYLGNSEMEKVGTTVSIYHLASVEADSPFRRTPREKLGPT